MRQPRHRSGGALSRRGLMAAGVGFAAGCAACGGAHGALAELAGAISRSAALGGKGYVVDEIRGRVYWVSDGAYNTMFAVSSGGVIACDAPPSLGANSLKAVAEVTDKPVPRLVYSHEHIDHIAAASIFPPTVKIVANRPTADLLALRHDPRRLMPHIVFDERYTLTVGDQTLELSYHGVNHSLDNTFIYAPRQRVLMLIGVIYPGWMPYKNLGVAVDMPGFVAAHRHALAFDFDTLVAGHVSRLGTLPAVQLQLPFLPEPPHAAAPAYAAPSFPPFLSRHAPPEFQSDPP